MKHFCLTPFDVVCCCPVGISDQKNPRHSGSSNIYGNKRVNNRTQLIAINKIRLNFEMNETFCFSNQLFDLFEFDMNGLQLIVNDQQVYYIM